MRTLEFNFTKLDTDCPPQPLQSNFCKMGTTHLWHSTNIKLPKHIACLFPQSSIWKAYTHKHRLAQKTHLPSCNLIRLGDLLLISDETMRYTCGIYAVVYLSITPHYQKWKAIAIQNRKLHPHLFKARIKGNIFKGIQPPVLDRFFWVCKCRKYNIDSVIFYLI